MPQIPFALQWSISENRLKALRESEDGCLISDNILNIPELKYFFKIYPNGQKEEDRGQTWLYLYIFLKHVPKVEVDYTYTIESAEKSIICQSSYEKPLGWGYLICSTDELFDAEKKFFVDGKLTLKINGVFSFESDSIVSHLEQQKWESGEIGNELWENDATKDFTIITKGQEIKAHKLILGIRSEVFNAMFNSNMKEAIENKVDIPDFSSIIVETAIKIIYNCNFVTSLSLDELMSLLQFFDKYNLPSLKNKVEQFLIEHISATTICRLTNFAVLTNSSKLQQKCMTFLMDSIVSKTPLSDFETLDKEILLKTVHNSMYRNVGTKEMFYMLFHAFLKK